MASSAATMSTPVGSAFQFDMDDSVYITLTCHPEDCWSKLEAMEQDGWHYIGTFPPAREMVFRRPRA